jgi:hypothetical protein
MTPGQVAKFCGSSKGPRLWILPSLRRPGHVEAWTENEAAPGPSWIRADRDAHSIAKAVAAAQARNGLLDGDEDDDSTQKGRAS